MSKINEVIYKREEYKDLNIKIKYKNNIIQEIIILYEE